MKTDAKTLDDPEAETYASRCFGELAEWLRSGLQIRVRGFESRTRLKNLAGSSRPSLHKSLHIRGLFPFCPATHFRFPWASFARALWRAAPA